MNKTKSNGHGHKNNHAVHERITDRSAATMWIQQLTMVPTCRYDAKNPMSLDWVDPMLKIKVAMFGTKVVVDSR